MLRTNKNIQEELLLRKTAFMRYNEQLKGIPGLTLLPRQDIQRNYAYYPILIEKEKFGKNRDELASLLAEKGIYARKYFYPLVSENLGFEQDMTVNTPKAKYYSRNVLCLPLYAHLTIEEIDIICKIIKE